MKRLSFIALGCALLVSGCSVFGPAVPTTKFVLTCNGQRAEWTCPKQFSATNITFTVSNSVAVLSVGGVASKNDPSVVDTSYAGQAALVKQWGDTTTQIMETAAQIAGQARP